MAVVRSDEASTSDLGHAYHVFLSFRGTDTRRTFTDHLYTALVNAGFRTFRDDDEIRRVEKVKSELDRAIKQSRASIIVFSKDYASSTWCLDELVTILEHRTASSHVVLPVFYDVDPSEVRKQTGSVAEAFGRHGGDERTRKWKTALADAAGLAGMCLRNEADGHESKFIQKIVKVVEDRLRRITLSVDPYLVGMHSRVGNIDSWLQDGATDVGIIVICGIGGIGKTTIAKFVYNSNFENFEASAFIPDVREISKQPNGLVCLQRQLLSKIMSRKHEKLWSVDEGIIKIKDAISCRKILLVLDDVDREEQLDVIIGMRSWFYLGSKIIITSRQKRLLKTDEVCGVHEVRKLNYKESLDLFSWHTFGQSHPVEAYMNHSKETVHHCGGLPLALKVLDRSLSGRSVDVWESALKKLRARLDSDIFEKLKISYDSLSDDHDRNLFLDIACFFVGKNKNWIVEILDACDFYTTVGIEILIDRCLLTIDLHNKVVMHQLIQDMGREIVRQESDIDQGKRSRLWHHKDSFYVLNEKVGTETIEGLDLNMQMFKEDRFLPKSFNIDNMKKRCLRELLGKSILSEEASSQKRHRFSFLSWHPVNATSKNSMVKIETDAFSMMHKLRLLKLNLVQLIGTYKEFPKRLRWLCWQEFPLSFIPTDFPMEYLITLEMPYSNLKQVWKRNKFLISLKFLDLSHSPSLTQTPDFSKVPNLENLILEGCTSLVEVDESIGNLERLAFLNLKDCKNLRELPRNIGMLKVVETLVISGCSNLKVLPMELRNMESLKVFEMDGIDQSGNVDGLPSAVEEVRPWYSFMRSHVSKPRRSPYNSWASLPRSLVRLSLANCNLCNDDFPSDFSSLSLLEELNLSGNPIYCSPGCLKGLSRLKMLSFKCCKSLQSIVGLPPVKQKLDVDGCGSLEQITYLSSSLTPVSMIYRGCYELANVQGWFKLQPISKFDAQMIEDWGLSNLENIEMDTVEEMHCRERILKRPIQGLHEFGKFSIFLPGEEIPVWVSHKSKGSSISVTAAAPVSPNVARIRGMKVCSVQAHSGQWEAYNPPPFTKISNKSKGLNWVYGPSVYGIPKAGQHVVWFSQWKFGIDELEAGDEVSVSVAGPGLGVVECGIEFVCAEEDEDEEEEAQPCNAYSYWERVTDREVTPPGMKGTRFLCSHYFARGPVGTKALRIKDDWFEQLFEQPEEADYMKYWLVSEKY